MSSVKLTIDGHQVEVPSGTSILTAARSAGIYIPALCHHPDLPPAEGSPAVRAIFQGNRKIENTKPEEQGKGCGLCVVEMEGEQALAKSCATQVRPGMVVVTDNEKTRARRQELLRALEGDVKAAWFVFEEDRMYSKRESELIQKYVQEHGRMPGSGTEEEELF